MPWAFGLGLYFWLPAFCPLAKTNMTKWPGSTYPKLRKLLLLIFERKLRTFLSVSLFALWRRFHALWRAFWRGGGIHTLWMVLRGLCALVLWNFWQSFIPYRDGVTEGDFLIEDYFLWDKTIKSMVDKAIESSHHPLKNLPKLSSRIKSALSEKYMTFSKEEFDGFIPLLDKILELI